MSTRVKICGITNLADAQAAVAAGADALGLMFYDQSPRHISLKTAAEIARALPPYIIRVGVFVNPVKEHVFRAIAECSLGLLQFHGDEPPEFCTQLPISMKAFRIHDAGSLAELPKYPTDAWLLDAYAPEIRGGTGGKFNWNLAVEAQKFGKPIFLAGGLTPGDVAGAVRKAPRVFGVDVSSGVESSPGKKDHAKVKGFIQAVKNA